MTINIDLSQTTKLRALYFNLIKSFNYFLNVFTYN
jgi:hypothetical protein